MKCKANCSNLTERYQAGHMDQAISLSFDAAKLLNDSEECEPKALTHYLAGCAYFAKGDVQKASASFAQARHCVDDTQVESTLLALDCRDGLQRAYGRR